MEEAKIQGWRTAPLSSAILTDIDGTLAPIAPTPEEARVPQHLKQLLREISQRYLLVAAISGRKTSEARELVGLDEVTYFGNHGFELLRSGEVEVVPEALPYLDRVEELERMAEGELGALGAYVEQKGITASVHFRNVPPEVGERCVDFVREEGEKLGLKVTVGRGIVEARPPLRADKGTAVRSLVGEYSPERAMFLGDDTTDLDAFRELEKLEREGVLYEILRVGMVSEEGPPEIASEADIVVEGVGELLKKLL
jgi:trehalose 6-phosphate phosphatase